MSWRLVPTEPTEDMLTASQCECGNAEERDGYITYDYTAMLTAAPRASEDKALVERVARCLCWTNGMNPDLTLGGDGQNFLWMEYDHQARAVLKMLEGKDQ